MSSRNNFVKEERDFLIETMSEKRDNFESPRKYFKMTQRKNSEWIKVTEIFNKKITNEERKVDQLNDLWRRIKIGAKSRATNV